MRRLAALLALAVGSLTAVIPPAAGSADEDASCDRVEVAVHLTSEAVRSVDVVGWLCVPDAAGNDTVLLASPPGLSTHAYWDWPIEKDTYSFVRHLTRAGHTVFTYDRVGTGASDRPPAAEVTLASQAHLQDQLVSKLRSGEIGGHPFANVVLVGNSLSTMINIFQAEHHGNVDGLVNTGIFVGPSPVGLAELFAAFHPTQADPKFSGRDDIPAGYATTQPGSRDQFFHLPSADPTTVALDEELKDTATLGEAATFGAWVPFTHLVDVPVLSVVGDRDGLACLDVCRPGGAETIKERQFWSASTCLEIEIVPDAGHFLQLHPFAASTFASLTEDWLARRIGDGDHQPPTAPCAG